MIWGEMSHQLFYGLPWYLGDTYLSPSQSFWEFWWSSDFGHSLGSKLRKNNTLQLINKLTFSQAEFFSFSFANNKTHLSLSSMSLCSVCFVSSSSFWLMRNRKCCSYPGDNQSKCPVWRLDSCEVSSHPAPALLSLLDLVQPLGETDSCNVLLNSTLTVLRWISSLSGPTLCKSTVSCVTCYFEVGNHSHCRCVLWRSGFMF